MYAIMANENDIIIVDHKDVEYHKSIGFAKVGHQFNDLKHAEEHAEKLMLVLS